MSRSKHIEKLEKELVGIHMKIIHTNDEELYQPREGQDIKEAKRVRRGNE